MKPMLRTLACMACAACGAAAAGDIQCRGVSPSEYAYAVHTRLERTRDPDAIRQVYERDFSAPFKSTYSFQEFYASVTGVQQRLQIGAGLSRDLNSRTLSRPEVVGNWSKAGSVKAMPISGERAAPGDQVAVEFFTSSGVGKIRQRLQVTCTEDGWKANGVWYQPSAGK
jgi:hypothetical protein